MGGVAFLMGASFCVCSSRLTGAAPFGSAEGAGTGCAGMGCAGAGFAAGGCEGIGQVLWPVLKALELVRSSQQH